MNGTSPFVFPARTRVLHVGPHKTGTTALQRSMASIRDDLAAHGLHYAGEGSQPLQEVLSLLARENPTAPKGAPESDRPWRQLVREVRQHRDERVLISSEFFADARANAMRAALGEIGGRQPHVLVTVRPLARILPSQWQQQVQNGARRTYDRWLRVIFDDPLQPTAEAFWWRHHHDRLIERWADLVGHDQVTVLVIDDSDHDRLLRDAESLFDLPEGLLPSPERTNRSLTLPEIELIRHFNKQFAKTELPKSVHSYAMRFGAARYVQNRTPAADEPAVTTPRWAVDRAVEVGREAAGRIAESGVRVIGDLDLLASAPDGKIRDDEPLPPIQLEPELAASALIGMMEAGSLPEIVAGEPLAERAPDLRPVPTSAIAKTLRRRLVERLRRLLR